MSGTLRRPPGALQRVVLVLALLLAPALIAGTARVAATAVPARIAFTQHGNVFFMDSTGGSIQTVTTRGRVADGFASAAYPWYAWSPDHRYLLLVRNRRALPGERADPRLDLLLLDRSGTVLRTLAVAGSSDFDPTWAVDGDEVAFAAQKYSTANAGTEVAAVDLQGRVRPLWHYAHAETCGSGFGELEPALLDYQAETGESGPHPRLQWSLRHHIAIYAGSYCGAALLMTDTATGDTRPFPFEDPALSPSGIVAAVSGALGADITGFPLPEVVLADTYGHIIRVVGPGELPAWSPSGRFLYYVQRAQQQELIVFCCRLNLPRNQIPNIPLRICSTAILRANADGSQPVRLALQDAYAFGTLHITPNGQSLVFSRIANDWAIWQHRLPGDELTTELLYRYRPLVSIQRFDLTGKLVTLARDAGRPAV